MSDAASPPAVIAADIGATSMRAAVVGADGRLLARASVPTEAVRGIEDATERLLALFTQVAAEAGRPVFEGIVGVGLASAGPIEQGTGIYRHPPNLPGWHGASMRSGISEALGLPIAIGHDATYAAVGETRFGAHRGARHLVYLTVSTGIGAGIVADGVPVTGHASGAGEAGHMIVQPGGPPCGVGCPGCLEGVASGSGIAASIERALAAGEASSLTVGSSAAEAFRAVEAGDPLATRIVDGALDGLAVGLANLLAVLDPEVIVLGGGVAQSLVRRWDDLLARVQARALPRYAEGVPVSVTTLGDDASLLGASVMAFAVRHPLGLPDTGS